MSPKPRRKVSLEAAKSAMRSSGSRALAVALITGFDLAADSGCPLTQMQKIHMTTMSVMCYQEMISGADSLEVDEIMENRSGSDDQTSG